MNESYCEECIAHIWYVKPEKCPLINILKTQKFQILSILPTAEEKGLTAKEISYMLKKSDSHIYPDLKKLENLGFIKKLDDGRYISLCINTRIEFKNGYVEIRNCPRRID